MIADIVTRLSAWQERRFAIHKLNRLDDHILADLGTSREDIEDFVMRRQMQKKAAPAIPERPSRSMRARQGLHRGDADRGDPTIAEAQLGRGGLGKIDDAAADERPTVVDGHPHRAPGALVGHH